MTFDEAVAYALTLPDTERGTSYGKPAVKVASVAIDLDTIEILKETDPETFWQSPHYVGWEGLLIRYDSKDADRVRETSERSRAWVAAKPKPRARKRK